MELFPGIQTVGLALLCHDALIVSDIHLGYEESLSKRGILTPYTHLTLKELQAFKHLPFRRLILNGDVKHEFGSILPLEWRDLIALFDSFKDKEITIVKGNHDVILAPIASKRNVSTVNELHMKDVLVLHGDQEPQEIPSDVKTVIIGHEHPSIELTEGSKHERYKCFAVGMYRKRHLIMMPAFSAFAEGRNLLSDDFKTPFVKDANMLDIFIVHDKTYHFGKIANLRAHLHR